MLQSTIEDFGYASRIARLRGHYFQYVPELVGYPLSVPPTQRLRLHGIGVASVKRLFTVAAMVGLVTAVLAGSAVGQPAAVVSDHVLLVATIAGVLVAIAVFAALIGFQVSTWRRPAARLLDEESAHTTRPEAGDCADPTSSLESSAERARRSARSAQFGRPPARLRGFDTKWTAALRVQLRSDT